MRANSKAFCIYIRSSTVGQLAGWEEAAKEDKDIMEQLNELFALVPTVSEVGVFHTGVILYTEWVCANSQIGVLEILEQIGTTTDQ